MAKCRECGAEIPEGEEYCENCFGKLNTVKDSESYLDSLLNAVMTEEPERREVVFRKKKNNPSVSASPKEEAVPVEEVPVPEEEAVPVPEPAEEMPVPEEEEPFKLFGAEPEEETAVPEDEDFFKLPGTEPAEEIAVPEDEDLFKLPGTEPVEEMPVPEDEDSFVPFETEPAEEEAVSGPEPAEETVLPDSAEAASGAEQMAAENDKETKEELPELKNYSIFDEIDESDISRMFGGDLPEESGEAAKGKEMLVSPEEEPEPVLFPEEVPEEEEEQEAFLTEEPEEREEAEPSEKVEFSDFADLFAGGGESEMDIQNDDEIEETGADADDGLESLLSGLDKVHETEDESGDTSGGLEPDLEQFLAGFGDEGDGLFTLDAEPEEEEELLKDGADDTAGAAAPESPKKQEDQSGEQKAAGKKKKEKKKKEKKEKQGRIGALYHRLFDNVKVDPSKIKPQPTKEEIEAKKKAAQEAKERSKEEKEALLAEKKEQERQEKAEKQRKAKEAKAEKKEKKLQEAKLLLQEMENTRINRAGAAIVFIFFAMIAVVILFGTDIFSYSLSIQNAASEFERDEYTRAYDEIYGLDVKDEDIVLYDRIMTVMYVQKHLNSYYNYYEMKDYPNALHSLLKGLQRYEKYIDLAVELEIDADLDSVRNSILTEISASFSMSEQEAMSIIQSASQLEYSIKVYDAVEKAE